MKTAAVTAAEARAVAEHARDEKLVLPSFAAQLFNGRFDPTLLRKDPPADPKERRRAAAFLDRLRSFANAEIDGDRFDREGEVPQAILDGLAEIGAFGIKIPRKYGGLELSQLSYVRALAIVGSRCASTSAYLSAHQSIGVPAPLIKFGTDEQKERYLPRLAKGALSAFALTEADVGSDPARMAASAELSEDGRHWVLNGEKLWTTNGPRAEIIVVMARTPPGPSLPNHPISAFMVETDWPGVEVTQECEFMGMRAISNGVMRFTDVMVPRENLLWEEGKGLKLALITLNTGRLSLIGTCATTGKLAVEMCRRWGNERVQWGRPVGEHDAVSQMIARVTASTFALEAVLELTSRLADAGSFDIRIEAAMAKLFASETGWRVVDDAMQVRGGRGYETADSLSARGETVWPIERALRDMRINRIFEGSSEIMHLFIAREATDWHFRAARPLLDPRAGSGRKLKTAARLAARYAWWYPTRFLRWHGWPRYRWFGPLAGHARFISASSARLAREIFHAMARYGAGLEERQAVLARLVDNGTDLMAMTATLLHARRVSARGDKGAEALADIFCRRARSRIEGRFATLFDNDDLAANQVARRTLAGEFGWLEEGGTE
ncbi:MAG: acyl-CoA dehydrogenase family protein [Gemmatimonadetes bacterium]|nr:acyl-CoA dehydrogenase family protein [Gemmatimonadota bacterium]